MENLTSAATSGFTPAEMNKVFLLLFFLSVSLLRISAQESFRLMFYNVENLFDTINNVKTNDDELTPAGNLHWNSYKYWKKLEDVSKVISSLGGKYPPAIVGLCEVENRSVMDDLTKQSSLVRHHYEYVMTNSADVRGANVALLYQRDQMRLLDKKTYTPKITPDNNRTTRDILHVVGEVVSGDTLDLFVCHFPSRSEGVAKSKPYRIAVAKLLRDKVERTLQNRKKAYIIIMGDFNDYPFDASIKETLGAKSLKDDKADKNLYNMFLHLGKNPEKASYKYRGKWNYLDQFIVSGTLLNQNNPIHIIQNRAETYAPEFLLEEDTKYGGVKPFRTYSGWSYLGGISDHLPIYIDVFVKE